MKRVLCLLLLLLLLLVLPACGKSPIGGKDSAANPENLADKPKTETVSLPETRPAEPVSAPAVVTEGRKPAENYDLPPSPEPSKREYRYDIERWISGGVIGLLAEAPDAAFYALPYTEGERQTALIRWGDSLAEFDWDFLTPRRFLPRMACFDIDGDQEDELMVLCYTGSGTGVSIYDLHILEKNPDGNLTDYAMPESLWREQVSGMLRLDGIGGRFFLSLGRELVEIIPGDAQITEGKEGPSTGWIADFRFLPEENALVLEGAVDLWHLTNYVASYTSSVCYADGMFTLTDFHLYSSK